MRSIFTLNSGFVCKHELHWWKKLPNKASTKRKNTRNLEKDPSHSPSLDNWRWAFKMVTYTTVISEQCLIYVNSTVLLPPLWPPLQLHCTSRPVRTLSLSWESSLCLNNLPLSDLTKQVPCMFYFSLFKTRQKRMLPNTWKEELKSEKLRMSVGEYDNNCSVSSLKLPWDHNSSQRSPRNTELWLIRHTEDCLMPIEELCQIMYSPAIN